MRDIHPVLTACLVFSLQVLLSAGKEPHPDTIKIGLLIQDKNSAAALRASELAVLKANQNRGVNGQPIRLVVKSMEGPWGTGSKEAVSMIFDENITGILGSHDGRNAHLVEQVAAKSGVVFISAWTSDPTLSEAFVPWFFNCVPNDLQQASSLTGEIYDKRKMNRIAIISDNSYDSQSALNNFMKVVTIESRPQPLKISVDNTTGINNLVSKLKNADIQCVVLFVQPPLSTKISKGLKSQQISLQVFGNISLLDENKISGQEMKNYEEVIIVSTGDLSGIEGAAFREDYKKAYGIFPGAVANYAFDGMNLLIEAIRKSGTDYEMIRKSLSEMRYDGVTGLIQFDERGNREGTPGLVEIINGIPVHLK